jgi:hypothetical protein
MFLAPVSFLKSPQGLATIAALLVTLMVLVGVILTS